MTRVFLSPDEMKEFFTIGFGSFNVYAIDIQDDKSVFDLHGSADGCRWALLMKEHPIPPGFLRHLFKYSEIL